jgi:hypothetical protein
VLAPAVRLVGANLLLNARVYRPSTACAATNAPNAPASQSHASIDASLNAVGKGSAMLCEPFDQGGGSVAASAPVAPRMWLADLPGEQEHKRDELEGDQECTNPVVPYPLCARI